MGIYQAQEIKATYGRDSRGNYNPFSAKINFAVPDIKETGTNNPLEKTREISAGLSPEIMVPFVN